MSYSAAVGAGVLVALLLDLVVLRTRLVTRLAFWVSYAILLVGQLVTNGILAGRGVVRYDPGAIIGDASVVLVGSGRLFWAPVEDVAFGFALVLTTLSLWVFWGRRGFQRTPPAGPPRWRD